MDTMPGTRVVATSGTSIDMARSAYRCSLACMCHARCSAGLWQAASDEVASSPEFMLSCTVGCALKPAVGQLNVQGPHQGTHGNQPGPAYPCSMGWYRIWASAFRHGDSLRLRPGI